MTHAERPHLDPELVDQSDCIMAACRAFSEDLPRQVGIWYGLATTEVAKQILEDTALRTLHFTDGMATQSRYDSYSPVAGYNDIAVQKVRLPDEAQQGLRPQADYAGRIIDLSLRSSDGPKDPNPLFWQCSLYLLRGEQPFLVDQEAIRNLDPQVSANSIAAMGAITLKAFDRNLYYLNAEEVLSLKVIIKNACNQKDMATTLEECAVVAQEADHSSAAAWFKQGTVYIRELVRQQFAQEGR